MSPKRERAWPLAGALALAGTALATGRVAAFVAAPLVFYLAWLATRTPIDTDTPRRWIGAGLGLLLAGALLGVARPGLAALVCAGLGLGMLVRGVRAALRVDRPPLPLETPRLGPALVAAVAADAAVVLAWEATQLVRPRLDYARVAADVRAAADRNREHGWLEHPELAYLAPPPLEKAHLESIVVRGAGSAERLRFASEFEPLDPEIREDYAALRANRSAHAVLWRQRATPRPTLICLHGYGQGTSALDALVWDVRWLHATLGLDVALFALPLHGPRAAGRRSGAGFLDGHPSWTNAALAQCVWDLRRLTGWLRAQGAPTVGIAGVGLGGYAAALFASVEPGLASAALLVPIVSLDAFAWRLMPPAWRAEARAAGVTEHWLSAAWARHSPLRLRPLVPHAARLVVGGLADRIVPPEQISALWEHWGHPAVHWYPGTHMLWLGRRGVRDHLASHLRSSLRA